MTQHCQHRDSTVEWSSGQAVSGHTEPCGAIATHLWEHQQQYANGHKEPLCARHCEGRQQAVATGNYMPPENVTQIEPQEQPPTTEARRQ